MTRAISRRRYVLLSVGAVMVVVADVSARSRPARSVCVDGAYEVRTYGLPDGGRRVDGFSVCNPGEILVAVDGGVWLGLWQRWLWPRRAERYDGIGCSREGALYVLQGRRVSRVVDGALHGNTTPVAELPPGSWKLSGAAGGAVWFFGRAKGGRFQVLRVAGDGEVEAKLEARRAFRDAVVCGPERVIGVLEDRLIVYDQGLPREVGFGNYRDIEGVACAGDATYLSTRAGLMRVEKDGRATPVAAGVHGTLRSVGDAVFVHSKDTMQVFKLWPSHRSQ